MKQLLLLSILLLSFTPVFSQSAVSKKQEKIKSTILKETQEGGKYDFFTPIKGQEYDGIQIKPGIFDTKLGLALIKWGSINRDLGIRRLEDVYQIFSEYKGRDINEREKEYIKIGYNREL